MDVNVAERLQSAHLAATVKFTVKKDHRSAIGLAAGSYSPTSVGDTQVSRGRRRTPIVESRWLLAELRQKRGWAGFVKQREAAMALGWPTSKLSMVEGGQRPLHEEDLTRLLELYQVPRPAWAKYFAACDIARKTEWWDYDLQHSIEEQLRKYTGLEQAAASLSTFQTSIFHGLLQTAEYTAALLRQRPERVGPALVEHLVRHRGRRQEVLAHPTDPLGLHMVVLEQALRQRVGEPEVMRSQLDHLVRTANIHEHVTIRVIPDDRPATFAANYGHFTVLAFPENRVTPVVFIEHMASATFLESMEDLDRYTALFEQLCELALSPDESLEKIKTLGKEEFAH